MHDEMVAVEQREIDTQKERGKRSRHQTVAKETERIRFEGSRVTKYSLHGTVQSNPGY